MIVFKIDIINNEEIIEGLIASVVFAIFGYYFKYVLKTNYLIYVSIPWFITWIFRKMSVHIYKRLVKIYKIKNTLYTINI